MHRIHLCLIHVARKLCFYCNSLNSTGSCEANGFCCLLPIPINAPIGASKYVFSLLMFSICMSFPPLPVILFSLPSLLICHPSPYFQIPKNDSLNSHLWLILALAIHHVVRVGSDFLPAPDFGPASPVAAPPQVVCLILGPGCFWCQKNCHRSWREPVSSNMKVSIQLLFRATAAEAAAKPLKLCPALCDPIDGSPPGSPVPGILQARVLEQVAIEPHHHRKTNSFSWVSLYVSSPHVFSFCAHSSSWTHKHAFVLFTGVWVWGRGWSGGGGNAPRINRINGVKLEIKYA